MKKLTLIISVLVACLSCEKKEQPIIPPSVPETSDSTTVVQIDIKKGYPEQAFFTLDDFSEVQRNVKTEWDLGVRFDDDKPFLFLNSSRSMKVVQSDFSFENTIDVTGWFRWDKPEGDFEDYRIGFSLDHTYIIDMGYDETLNHLGYKKIEMFMSGNSYKLKSANLDNSSEYVQDLISIAGTEYVSISLSESANQIFPSDEQWDFFFTNYTHEFDSITPYLVAGLLINPMNVEVAEYQATEFDSISVDEVSDLDFSSNQDAIGYDWKEYFIDEGYYLIYTENNYIIHKAGAYYKLRFLDFYNERGETGNFKFEIQKL